MLALLRNWETYDAEMWLKVHPGKDGDVDAQEVMEDLCSWRGCVQPGMSLSLAEHHQPASEVRKYKGDKEAAGKCTKTHQTFEESFSYMETLLQDLVKM